MLTLERPPLLSNINCSYYWWKRWGPKNKYATDQLVVEVESEVKPVSSYRAFHLGCDERSYRVIKTDIQNTVQLTKSDETSTSELGLPAMKDLDTNEAIMKIINILCDP